MTLNNQAVLAYLKQNFQQCLDLFTRCYDIVDSHLISYFNYLLLCWESGVFTDDYVLDEIYRSAQVTPSHNCSSFLFAIVYEAQNNWHAA